MLFYMQEKLPEQIPFSSWSYDKCDTEPRKIQRKLSAGRNLKEALEGRCSAVWSNTDTFIEQCETLAGSSKTTGHSLAFCHFISTVAGYFYANWLQRSEL